MPALMQMLCEYHSGDRMSYPTLRLALLSGDWIPLTLPEQMRERLNETMDIISLGGATECAIWSVYYPIGEGNRRGPVFPTVGACATSQHTC